MTIDEYNKQRSERIFMKWSNLTKEMELTSVKVSRGSELF